jgi:hypothetical protein
VARWLKNNDGDRAAARRDLEALAKDGNEIAADAVELIDKGSDGLTRNFVVFDEELLNRINVLDGDGKLQKKMSVIKEYAAAHPKAFDKLFGGKQKISRKKFEAGNTDTVEMIYARVNSKLEATRRYKAGEAEARNRKPDTRYRPNIRDIESELDRLGYKTDPGPEIPGEKQFSGRSLSGDTTEFGPDPGISIYYKHPDTGVTVRLSDHAAVYPRSSRQVMVHPGSFKTRDDVVSALEQGTGSNHHSTGQVRDSSGRFKKVD